jgi:glycosyltransferase involved in cell wall biosynthesis
MVTVVIAAHDEEAVIGRCLDALRTQSGVDAMEIIVSANGCHDRTGEIARARGAVVIDRPEPGKAGALNAADQMATQPGRIYLDADIVVPTGGVADVLGRLGDGVLAAVPRRRVVTDGRPLAVKGYFAINERLPVFTHGLFGRGMIALSEEGRRRFDRFPDLIADDLFLDSLFADAEKAEAPEVEIFVEAPLTTKSLLRRLIRVRRGNTQMRAASSDGAIEVDVRASDKWSWLRDVVLREPRLILAAIPYLLVTLSAAMLARRTPKAGAAWGRDDSTRVAPFPGATAETTA